MNKQSVFYQITQLNRLLWLVFTLTLAPNFTLKAIDLDTITLTNAVTRGITITTSNKPSSPIIKTIRDGASTINKGLTLYKNQINHKNNKSQKYLLIWMAIDALNFISNFIPEPILNKLAELLFPTQEDTLPDAQEKLKKTILSILDTTAKAQIITTTALSITTNIPEELDCLFKALDGITRSAQEIVCAKNDTLKQYYTALLIAHTSLLIFDITYK
ncbi:MAG: hypothetical protein ABH827_00290 [bacterium]